MKQHVKHLLGFLTLFLTLFVMDILPVHAQMNDFGIDAEIQTDPEDKLQFWNIYERRRWANAQKIHYTTNSAGNLEVICYNEKHQLVRLEFDSEKNLIGKKYIDLPLSLWGGFYETADNYFVSVGQKNHDTIDDVVVIKVLKYSKQWELLGEADFTGGELNVAEAFCGGNATYELVDNILYLYTSRKMYSFHQSDITVAVNIDTMEPIIVNVQPYSSHCFNEYIHHKGNDLYFVGHGDSHPRAVNVHRRYTDENGNKQLKEINLFNILGEHGDNTTGLEISGFETGQNGNIVIGISVPHEYTIDGVTGFDPSQKKNVFISIFNDDLSENEVFWLTNYNPASSDIIVGDPALIKVDEDTFVVMFNEQKGEVNTVRYMLIDSSGNIYAERAYEGMRYKHSSEPFIENDQIYWLDKNDNSDVARWYHIPYITETKNDILFHSQLTQYYKYSDNLDRLMVSYNPENGSRPTWTSSDTNVVDIVNNFPHVKGIGHSSLTASCDGQSATIPSCVYWIKNPVSIFKAGETVEIQVMGEVPEDQISYEWIEGTGEVGLSQENNIVVDGLKHGIYTLNIYIADQAIPVTIVYYDKDQEPMIRDTENKTLIGKYHEETRNNSRLYITNDSIYMQSEKADTDVPVDASFRTTLFTPDKTLLDAHIPYYQKYPSYKMDISSVTDEMSELKAFLYGDSGKQWVGGGKIKIINGEKYFYYDNVNSQEVYADPIPPQKYPNRITEAKPDVTLTYQGYTLVKDVDYTVEYKHDGETGKCKANIQGLAPFSMRMSLEFDASKESSGNTDSGNTDSDKAAGWKQDNTGWWYVYADGTCATGWAEIEGYWYYFNESGYMETGWLVADDNTWYYMDEAGHMVTGWKDINGSTYYFHPDGHMAANETIDGYYVDADGVYVKDNGSSQQSGGWKQNDTGWWYAYSDGSYASGWTEIEGYWYYFDESGYMATGWMVTDDNTWYYMDEAGHMATGWKDITGYTYYFHPDGHMAANETIDGYYVDADGVYVKDNSSSQQSGGWEQNNTGWWYTYSDGSYASGWTEIDGYWYYFDESGYMATGWMVTDDNTWYYMDEAGRMAAGWCDINGYTYYFYPDGHMAADETIDGYYVDADGVYAA